MGYRRHAFRVFAVVALLYLAVAAEHLIIFVGELLALLGYSRHLLIYGVYAAKQRCFYGL